MTRVGSNNYITIQGWMITELKLSGNELLVYALIYGFSQDGNSKFQGSSSYIAEWLNISNVSVFSILKRLINKGLLKKIEKIVNNVKLCDYETLHPINNLNGGTKETLYPPYKETLYPPHKETLYHNNSIDNNSIDNNKDIYKDDFFEFWSYYPKQRAGSKEKAFKSYLKVIKEKRATHEQLIKSVIDYGKSDEVARGFAKGCSAWLNDDRFLSDYSIRRQLTLGEQIDEHNLRHLEKAWGTRTNGF